ncbi:DUF2934 domain-containing protein [Methyloglobulus sp.]|uniref:DUF2934 domain-containing protein n=1 Tax=Methyloglobulus sp. TaxID=2518622 RepID=UPI003989A847
MATNAKKFKDQEISTDEKTIAVSERDDIIAELAYYKAEKRLFEPGYEREDWFETERGCLTGI